MIMHLGGGYEIRHDLFLQAVQEASTSRPLPAWRIVPSVWACHPVEVIARKGEGNSYAPVPCHGFLQPPEVGVAFYAS